MNAPLFRNPKLEAMEATHDRHRENVERLENDRRAQFFNTPLNDADKDDFAAWQAEAAAGGLYTDNNAADYDSVGLYYKQRKMKEEGQTIENPFAFDPAFAKPTHDRYDPEVGEWSQQRLQEKADEANAIMAEAKARTEEQIAQYKKLTPAQRTLMNVYADAVKVLNQEGDTFVKWAFLPAEEQDAHYKAMAFQMAKLFVNRDEYVPNEDFAEWNSWMPMNSGKEMLQRIVEVLQTGGKSLENDLAKEYRERLALADPNDPKAAEAVALDLMHEKGYFDYTVQDESMFGRAMSRVKAALLSAAMYAPGGGTAPVMGQVTKSDYQKLGARYDAQQASALAQARNRFTTDVMRSEAILEWMNIAPTLTDTANSIVARTIAKGGADQLDTGWTIPRILGAWQHVGGEVQDFLFLNESEQEKLASLMGTMRGTREATLANWAADLGIGIKNQTLEVVFGLPGMLAQTSRNAMIDRALGDGTVDRLIRAEQMLRVATADIQPDYGLLAGGLKGALEQIPIWLTLASGSAAGAAVKSGALLKKGTAVGKMAAKTSAQVALTSWYANMARDEFVRLGGSWEAGTAIGLGVGLIQSFIETEQVSQLFGSKVTEQQVHKAIARAATYFVRDTANAKWFTTAFGTKAGIREGLGILKDTLALWAVESAQETFEEGLQKFAETLGIELGLSGDVIASLKKAASDGVKEMYETANTMGWATLIGGTRRTARQVGRTVAWNERIAADREWKAWVGENNPDLETKDIENIRKEWNEAGSAEARMQVLRNAGLNTEGAAILNRVYEARETMLRRYKDDARNFFGGLALGGTNAFTLDEQTLEVLAEVIGLQHVELAVSEGKAVITFDGAKDADGNATRESLEFTMEEVAKTEKVSEKASASAGESVYQTLDAQGNTPRRKDGEKMTQAEFVSNWTLHQNFREKYGKGLVVRGTRDGNTIKLDTSRATIFTTLHEVFHFLENRAVELGMITREELVEITKDFRDETGTLNSEKIADYFAGQYDFNLAMAQANRQATRNPEREAKMQALRQKIAEAKTPDERKAAEQELAEYTKSIAQETKKETDDLESVRAEGGRQLTRIRQRDERIAQAQQRAGMAVTRQESGILGKVKQAFQGLADAFLGYRYEQPSEKIDAFAKYLYDQPVGVLARIADRAKTMTRFKRGAQAKGAQAVGSSSTGAQAKQYSMASASRFDPDAYNRALEMEQRGESRENIFDETGMWKDRDGHWLAEIPDLTLAHIKKLKDAIQGYFATTDDDSPVALTFVEVLKYVDAYGPDMRRLVEAYPRLNDMLIWFHKGAVTKNGYTAVTRLAPADNTRFRGQTLKKGQAVDISIAMGRELYRVRSSLAHELHHFIQGEEGWPHGTTFKESDFTEANETLREINYLTNRAEISARVVGRRTLPQYKKFDVAGKKFYPWETERKVRDITAREVRKLRAQAKQYSITADTAQADREYAEVEAKYRGTDQWMKAPNGKPTNLTERQWVQVRTPSFKAWFGDWENDPANASKVLDRNGEPKVVYHWTQSESPFDAFAREKAEPSMYGESFYFFTNRAMAENWGNFEGEARTIMELFLNVRTPYVESTYGYEGDAGFNIDALKEAADDDFAEIYEKLESMGYEFHRSAYEQKYLPVYFYKSKNKRNIPRVGLGTLAGSLKRGDEEAPRRMWPYSPVIKSVIEGFGYDSVIGHLDGYTQIAVFDPNQIKSATDNIGTFSRERDPIRYSVTAEQDAAYARAVSEGDTDLAMQMVRQAAAQAMPNTKVVDDDGLPMVVYHSTNADFTAFDESKIGSHTDEGMFGRGFYFSSDERMSSILSNVTKKQVKVLLNMTNPLVLTMSENERPSSARKSFDKYNAEIKNGGYDGVIIKYTDGMFAGQYEIVALSPSQIKSADPATYDDSGNLIPLSKRFNMRKDDIRYSIAVTKDNTPFVLLDRPLDFDWNNIKKVEAYLVAQIGDGHITLVDNKKIKIGKDLPEEYLYSNNGRQMFRNKRLRKLRSKMAKHFDELIIASDHPYAEPTVHKMREGGVYYKRKIEFGVFGHDVKRGYEAELLTYTVDGEEFLYDIIGVKESPSLTEVLNQEPADTGALSPFRMVTMGTIPNGIAHTISQSGENVKRKNSTIASVRDGDMDVATTTSTSDLAAQDSKAINLGEPQFSIGSLYTGSAADYMQPSLHYVGTGEGQQVYGYGLYASNRRGVAESYAKNDADEKGGPHRFTLGGDRWEVPYDPYRSKGKDIAARAIILSNGDFASAHEKVKQSLEKFLATDATQEKKDDTRKLAQDIDAILDEWEKDGLAKVSEYIYEQTFFTDRPEGDESHLMSWYEPLSEENRQRIIDQILKEGWVQTRPTVMTVYGHTYTPFHKGENEQDYENKVNVWHDAPSFNVYQDLAESLSPKAASEFLARAGIDGVKYPVDSYGKTVKDGDEVGWNYVSFRDDNIRIDHKWKDGEKQFSITTDESVSMKLRDWAMSTEAAELGWTPEKVEEVITETQKLIRTIHGELAGDKNYDEWVRTEPTIRYDWRDGEMKPVVTWVRGNIEYKYDMSADTFCINNEGLEEILASPVMADLMIHTAEYASTNKKLKKDNRGYTSSDYLTLYETLRDLGFVVPCKGCFDAAMRLKMLPSVAQKFTELVNETIDERNKDPEAFDKSVRDMTAKEYGITGLPLSAKNKKDAIRIGVSGDNLTEHVSWTQLMSAEGQTKALADWGGIFRAWQRTGAGRPKDKLMPEPWTGVMVSTTSTIIGPAADKTPSFRQLEVNTGTGLRRNSHSEFRPILAIDEIQFMREAYLKGLFVFKYMKELDDVRLFGNLGVKFNMSAFPTWVPDGPAAGLDADGNYIMAEESVGGREFPYIGEDGKQHYDGMKGLEEAKRYINEDVSLSSVVLSVPHLIKTMTDVPTPTDKRGTFGSLIPFHNSGATAESLRKQGLGECRATDSDHPFAVEAMVDYHKGVTNFEQVQNDRFGTGWEVVEGKRAGTEVEPGHKIEFANGTHYYNKALGLHLFSSGYIYDHEIPAGGIDKKNLPHRFEVDYNNKVREIGGDYAYKAAADFYVDFLHTLGLLPRFDFEVAEETFLQMCRDAKVDPHHPKLGYKPGQAWNPILAESYYSLFCDYGMTDPATGKWSPHRPVGLKDGTFALPDNAVEIITDGVRRYSERKEVEASKFNDAIIEYCRREIKNGKMTAKGAMDILKKHDTFTKEEIAPLKKVKSQFSIAAEMEQATGLQGEIERALSGMREIRYSIADERDDLPAKRYLAMEAEAANKRIEARTAAIIVAAYAEANDTDVKVTEVKDILAGFGFETVNPSAIAKTVNALRKDKSRPKDKAFVMLASDIISEDPVEAAGQTVKGVVDKALEKEATNKALSRELAMATGVLPVQFTADNGFSVATSLLLIRDDEAKMTEAEIQKRIGTRQAYFEKRRELEMLAAGGDAQAAAELEVLDLNDILSDERMAEFVQRQTAIKEAAKGIRAELDARDAEKAKVKKVEKKDDKKPEPAESEEEAPEEEALAKLLKDKGLDFSDVRDLVVYIVQDITTRYLEANPNETLESLKQSQVYLHELRKTLAAHILTASTELTYGLAREQIRTEAGKIAERRKFYDIVASAEQALTRLQSLRVKQSRKSLIADMIKLINDAIGKASAVATTAVQKRKLSGDMEMRLSYIRKVLKMGDTAVRREMERVNQVLAAGNVSESAAVQDTDERDIAKAIMQRDVLNVFGGAKHMMPAQLEQLFEFLQDDINGARENFEAELAKVNERITNLKEWLALAIIQGDPDVIPNKSAVAKGIDSLMGIFRLRLEALVDRARGPIREKALEAIDEIDHLMAQAADRLTAQELDNRKAVSDLYKQCYGSEREAKERLNEELPEAVRRKLSFYKTPLTRDHAIYLYAYVTQNDYESNAAKFGRLDPDYVNTLLSVLDSRDLAFLQGMRKILHDQFPALQTEYRKMTGSTVFTTPNYFPVKPRLTKADDAAVALAESHTWSPIISEMTPRVRHGYDTEEVRATAIFFDRLNKYARMMAYGRTGHIVNSVLLSGTVTHAIESAWGKDDTLSIRKILLDAESGVKMPTDAVSTLANWTTHATALGQLAYNLSSSFVQLASGWIASGHELGIGKVLKNQWQVMFGLRGGEAVARAKRILMASDFFKARYGGGLDIHAREAMSMSNSSLFLRFYTAGMKPIQIADWWTSMNNAIAVFMEAERACLDKGLSPEEAQARAISAAGSHIERTQQSGRTHDQTNLVRRIPLARMFMMFASNPLQLAQYEIRAFQQLARGVPGASNKVVNAVLINHVLVPVFVELARMVFKALTQGDDDDLTEEEERKRRAEWAISFGIETALGQFNAVPLLGSATSAFANRLLGGESFSQEWSLANMSFASRVFKESSDSIEALVEKFVNDPRQQPSWDEVIKEFNDLLRINPLWRTADNVADKFTDKRLFELLGADMDPDKIRSAKAKRTRDRKKRETRR